MEHSLSLKKMELKARIQYVLDYYKVFLIGGILLLGIFIYALIQTFGIHKDTVLHVTLVNADEITVSDSSFFDTFFQTYFDPRLEKMDVSSNLNISIEEAGMESGTAYQVLSAQILTGEVDALITDKAVFSSLALGGALADVRDILSEDEIAQYEEFFVYTTDEETGETYPAGISLAKSETFTKEEFLKEPAVMGVGVTSKNRVTSEMLLHYIME